MRLIKKKQSEIVFFFKKDTELENKTLSVTTSYCRDIGGERCMVVTSFMFQIIPFFSSLYESS